MNNASSSDGISRFLGNSCQLSFGRRKQFLSDAQHSIHKILRRGSEIALYMCGKESHTTDQGKYFQYDAMHCVVHIKFYPRCLDIYTNSRCFLGNVSYWILIFKEGKVVIAIRFRFSSLEETAQTTMKWSGRN